MFAFKYINKFNLQIFDVFVVMLCTIFLPHIFCFPTANSIDSIKLLDKTNLENIDTKINSSTTKPMPGKDEPNLKHIDFAINSSSTKRGKDESNLENIDSKMNCSGQLLLEKDEEILQKPEYINEVHNSASGIGTVDDTIENDTDNNGQQPNIDGENDLQVAASYWGGPWGGPWGPWCPPWATPWGPWGPGPWGPGPWGPGPGPWGPF